MKKPTSVLAGLAIGAAALGIIIAPPAAADCQDNGGVTVCAQGSVSGGDQAPDNPGGADPSPNGPDTPDSVPYGGGCTTQYGTYQNCNAGNGG